MISDNTWPLWKGDDKSGTMQILSSLGVAVDEYKCGKTKVHKTVPRVTNSFHFTLTYENPHIFLSFIQGIYTQCQYFDPAWTTAHQTFAESSAFATGSFVTKQLHFFTLSVWENNQHLFPTLFVSLHASPCFWMLLVKDVSFHTPQRHVRGLLCRQRVKRMRVSLLVQRLWRAYCARKDYKYNAAAIQVQVRLVWCLRLSLTV